MAADRDDFFNPSYWDEFYADDDEAFDWYSSEEWVAEIVEGAAVDSGIPPASAKVLDIGCGTSPLACTLVERHGFSAGNVVGADFSTSAIQTSTALAREMGFPIKFFIADATNMNETFTEGQFDFVVDKGCLDCFISSDATTKIDQYMEQVRRILKPSGTFFVLPVNAADIPRLISTGEMHLDEQALGPSVDAAREKWKVRKRIERGGDGFRPIFHIENIRAQDEKHLYSLKKLGNHSSTEPLELTCNQCSSINPLPRLPVTCSSCGVRLRRFALS